MGAGRGKQSARRRSVAAALSRLFDGSADIADPGLNATPSFEPAAELPEISREAERVRRSRQLDGEGTVAEFGAELPELPGAVIFRDSEEPEGAFDATARS